MTISMQVFHTKSCREQTAALGLDEGWCCGAGCYLIATGLPVPRKERAPFRLPDHRPEETP